MKANKITIQPVPFLTWHILFCLLWIYRLWLWKVSLTLKPSLNSITEVLSNYNLTQSRVIHPSIDITCYEVYSSLLYPLSQSEAEMLSIEHCPLRRRCSLCPIHQWTNLFEWRTVIFFVRWNLFSGVRMNLCYMAQRAVETELSSMKVQKSRNKLSPHCDFMNMPIKLLLGLVEPVVSAAPPNLKY